MKLIIGLGNPGKRYEGTRHNIGFRVIDALICCGHSQLAKGKGPFQINEFPFQGGEVVVAKPTVFMNESGTAVQAILKQFDISPGQCLVVVDDVNLPIGTIRLRLRGSAGGHHGLESIIRVLGTENFPRLRIGVGAGDLSGQDLTHYVLSRFTKEERDLLLPHIDRARDACLEWVKTGATEVMQRYNN